MDEWLLYGTTENCEISLSGEQSRSQSPDKTRTADSRKDVTDIALFVKVSRGDIVKWDWTKIVAALLVVLILPPSLDAVRATEPQQLPFSSELQQILDEGVLASNCLGVSAAVIAEGYTPWIGVAGYSVRATNDMVLMRSDMLFEIGSVDKNMVTVIMLQLVEEGRMALDDPLSKWISGYSQLPAEVTVRDLIGSTSGIAEWVDHPDSIFQGEFSPQNLSRSWTVDQMLKELVGPPEFTPGEKWQYSTTGFRLAREIIELETGQPIADVIQLRLLDPLNISDMWLEPSWPIPSRYTVAHEWRDIDGDQNVEDITDIPKVAFYDLKAAPVYATAIDLARYCQGLFHDGALVSANMLAEMLDFREADDPTEPMAASYGLGTGTFNIPGISSIEHYGHGGNGLGYVVMMLYLPQRQASVVVMTNDQGTTMSTVGAAFLQAVDRGLASPSNTIGGIPAFLLESMIIGAFVGVGILYFYKRRKNASTRGKQTQQSRV